MAKYTPAPWSIEIPKESNGYVNIRMGYKSVSVYGDVVKTLGHPSEESMATARLISKAPEMLEMLKEYADTMGIYSPQQRKFNEKAKELIKSIEG